MEPQPDAVRLRAVRPEDDGLYLALRGDDLAMADLGGPLPEDQILRSLAREVADTDAGRAWVSVIELAHKRTWLAVGNLTVVTNGEGVSEIGWMVLPQWQRRGIAAQALSLALADPRRAAWGPLHAYPAASNDASNRLCASTGFVLRGAKTVEFYGQLFETNEWVHG